MSKYFSAIYLDGTNFIEAMNASGIPYKKIKQFYCQGVELGVAVIVPSACPDLAPEISDGNNVIHLEV